MVSDRLPYSGNTLSMITDIPLPTVQSGLTIFAEMEMIDRQDGAIYIRNWRKYQSEDKLEKRRETNRLRQQRYQLKERKKLAALPPPKKVSVAVTPPRHVTSRRRTDKIKWSPSSRQKFTEFKLHIQIQTQLVGQEREKRGPAEKNHGLP
ncbi:phage replisome organizer N-terminal domain-containing protein [Desulforhopalus vacuolatus]|uniref:phage replisome organizer N-terminal domain-containing protein n=1 Tax=Desulforhopalus vacuolatus TaxID=40414 RepID=UPI001963C4C8|nr:phage replisome organizer N-terminal domain-containing protein [Desulforhopalus vacuolatus]